jgi:hypothetical protein
MELFFYPHAGTGNPTGKILRVWVRVRVSTTVGYVPVAILVRSIRHDCAIVCVRATTRGDGRTSATVAAACGACGADEAACGSSGRPDRG